MKLKRVLATVLTIAMAAESFGISVTAMASEIDVQSSVLEEAEESSSVLSEIADIASAVEEPAENADSEMVSLISELEESAGSRIVAGDDESEISSLLPELGASVVSGIEEEDVPELQEETGSVCLEDKILLACRDAEEEKLAFTFDAFAKDEKYCYAVCDKDGNVLEEDALIVEESETKGDLKEIFDGEKVCTAMISLDKAWPQEFSVRIYDAEKEQYIVCGVNQESALKSVSASANENNKVDVAWTGILDYDGCVVALTGENGEVVDSHTVENVSACAFASLDEGTQIEITPYIQEDGSEPVYYEAVTCEVALFSDDMLEVQTLEGEPDPAVYPDQVGAVSAVAGDQRVTLNWSAANNATAYIVYIQNSATGVFDPLYTVDTPNCTVMNLHCNTTYTFAVESIRDDNGVLTRAALSAPVAAMPYMIAPNAPVGLSGSNAKGATTLTWTANGIANGYEIYSWNYKKSCYEKIGNTAETRYVDTKAGGVDKHKYMVKAFRQDNGTIMRSANGPEVIVYGADTISAAKSVHPIYYSARITRKTGLYQKFRQDKTKQGTIKKGEKVTIIYRRWKQSLVSYKGKKYYVYNGAMRVTGQSYTKKDYSTQAKELFVKDYKSSCKYLVWISTYTQRINIFKGKKGNWKLIKTETVSTGKITSYTPLGNFTVTKKKKAHYYGRNFYKYLTYFRGDNKMHTRPARRKTGKYLDARLGQPLSGGCVRLRDNTAAWVYKNMPKGSTILVH